MDHTDPLNPSSFTGYTDVMMYWPLTADSNHRAWETSFRLANKETAHAIFTEFWPRLGQNFLLSRFKRAFRGTKYIFNLEDSFWVNSNFYAFIG